MGAVTSVINLKGGVGKSTLAMILAEHLVFNKCRKALVIDKEGVPAIGA